MTDAKKKPIIPLLKQPQALFELFFLLMLIKSLLRTGVGGVPVPPGCWGSALALERFVHGQDQPGRVGLGKGDVPHSALRGSPWKRGSREAEWQEGVPPGRGNLLFQGHGFPCDGSFLGRSQEELSTEHSSAPARGTWQYHTVFSSFWLADSSGLDFPKVRVEV